MMRPTSAGLTVYVCRQPVDMRKSVDGLAMLVESQLGCSPFEGALFVFGNRARDKLKLLYWERNGFVLWYKRLERERFFWPTHLAGETIELTSQQLNWLLDGYDLSRWQPHRELHYRTVL